MRTAKQKDVFADGADRIHSMMFYISEPQFDDVWHCSVSGESCDFAPNADTVDTAVIARLCDVGEAVSFSVATDLAAHEELPYLLVGALRARLRAVRGAFAAWLRRIFSAARSGMLGSSLGFRPGRELYRQELKILL